MTAEVPVVEAGAPEAEVGDAEHPSVDDLFARLRAESSSEVVARDVLDQEPSADAGPSTNGSGEPPSGAATLAQRDAAVAPVRTALARQLKRVLADEQNEVLDRLRQRNASLAVDDVLGAAALHPGMYGEAAEDHLWAAATAGAHSLSDLDGEELHATLEARRCWTATSTPSRQSWWCRCGRGSPRTSTLRATGPRRPDACGRPIGSGRAGSTSWARTWSAPRTGRAAYAVLSPGTPVCWVVDPSGPGCPDAEDNVLAGPVPAGEPFRRVIGTPRVPRVPMPPRD